jgi:hypothetical protein
MQKLLESGELRRNARPMTIKVALHHRTQYAFDRPVGMSPHEVRLRPAAHCRTPIESYSFKVKPAKHFLNWQQDRTATGSRGWCSRRRRASSRSSSISWPT